MLHSICGWLGASLCRWALACRTGVLTACLPVCLMFVENNILSTLNAALARELFESISEDSLHLAIENERVDVVMLMLYRFTLSSLSSHVSCSSGQRYSSRSQIQANPNCRTPWATWPNKNIYLIVWIEQANQSKQKSNSAQWYLTQSQNLVQSESSPDGTCALFLLLSLCCSHFSKSVTHVNSTVMAVQWRRHQRTQCQRYTTFRDCTEEGELGDSWPSCEA